MNSHQRRKRRRRAQRFARRFDEACRGVYGDKLWSILMGYLTQEEET